jgi:uncharacterized membrane protein
MNIPQVMFAIMMILIVIVILVLAARSLAGKTIFDEMENSQRAVKQAQKERDALYK